MATYQGTQAVPTGTTAYTVTGTFTAVYQVTITPSWVTSYSVTGITATQFVVTFGTPSPAGGSFGWVVVPTTTAPASGQVALADYLTATRQLLRDENAASPLYPTADLTSYINRAMQQRDLDLGLNRSRISLTLTANIYEYTFANILANGSVLDGVANPNPIDVISVTVWPLGTPPQGIPYVLGRWPYSRLAWLLTTSYPSYPAFYCVYGPSTLMLGPVPAFAYPCYVDFMTYASALVNPGDPDPMPYPYTDPVPFAAAGFARFSSGQEAAGKMFYNDDPQRPGLYQTRLGMVRRQTRRWAVRRPYTALPWRMR